MKKAILGSLAVLPLAAAGMLANTSDAEAAVIFQDGALLQLNADFVNTAAKPLEVKFLKNGSPQDIGQYGIFGVGEDSTTPFDAFNTFGDTTNTDYKILSVDFTDSSTYLDKTFLSAINALGDDFQFKITDTVTPINFGTTDGIINISDIKGKFTTTTPTGSADGFGFLSGTFIRNNGTFSGTFTLEVASVPEPATILGLGVVAGSLALSRAGKKNKA